jgi:ABC-2 type transport system permease protein
MTSSMTTQSNPVPESQAGSQGIAPPGTPATRPMYWSVRRELWENRSLYVAPLAAAALGMFAFLVSLIYLPDGMNGRTTHHPMPELAMLAMPYGHTAWLLMLTAFIVGVFYSLDALHGERRDRSILFWKSLPVSDRTTVLSKASIPLAVLPLLVFAMFAALQLPMLVLNTLVLLLRGGSASALWAQLPLFQMDLTLLYSLAVIALWHAPIYGWLLLVSGWARRATFLWAVLPLLAIGAFEMIAFRTSHFAALLTARLIGFAEHAFAFQTPSGVPIDPHFIPVTQLTPVKFLSSPGLWIGLGVAAAFLAAAVRLRRYRGPI